MFRASTSAAVLLCLATVPAWPAFAQEAPLQPRADFVMGGGEGGSRIKLAAWRDARRRDLVHTRCTFFEALNKDRTLRAISRADIFFFSGHAGVPKSMPGKQVLQVENAPDGSPVFLTAQEIRAGVRGEGPRLVILNGCKTTYEGETIAPQDRLPTGFGIGPGTRGRALLGWATLIPGFLADDQIGRFLGVWAKRNEDGLFPTLEEARLTVGIENLNILGDRNLRYRTPYLVKADDEKAKVDRPIRFYLEPLPGETALATIDFGTRSEAELRKVGLNRFLELRGSWSGGAYVLRDPAFTDFVHKLSEGFANLFSGKDDAVSVDVRKAEIHVRLDLPRLRLTVRLEVTATAQGKTRDFLNGDYQLVAEPE